MDKSKELDGMREKYSKAHCSDVAWKTDVNLHPPKAWGKPFCLMKAPVGDQYIWDYYNALQYILYDTGHPETIDRTSEPRKHQNKEYVNITLLSSPVECTSILLEGGKQLPGGLNLVLSPSWLSKVPSEEDPSLSTLLLHKSISFHANGVSFIDEFDPPRRVTYFMNYFSENVTYGQRNDGVEIEKNIDCPVGNSVKSCDLVGDKVWTRDIMATVGMAIPETLALRRMPARKLSSANAKIKTVNFESYPSLDMIIVEKEIAAFSKRLQLSNIQKVVVQPSGAKYCDSVGISLHSTSHVSSIVKATEELLMEIAEGCSVLVEEFVEHLLPFDAGERLVPLWSADASAGFCVRSTVCRDYDDVPVTTLINCAIADKSSPINIDSSVCQSLDSTLLAYNVFDKSARQQLEQDIRIQSADVLRMIIEKEQLLGGDDRGALRGQTDVIGIDMVVTKKEGKLVPFGTGVRSQHCTINTQMFDFMMGLGESMLVQPKVAITDTSRYTHDTPNRFLVEGESAPTNKRGTAGPFLTTDCINMKVNVALSRLKVQQSRYYYGNSVGQSVRPLVRNMISRSQRYAMRGKQIVVIVGGGVYKRKNWSDVIAEYAVKIILIASNPNHPAREQVHRFIPYDIDDHKEDLAHARGICNLIHTRGIHVDGCLTFSEDCVPLAARVNEIMGTRGSSYEAALTAKKKSRTQNVLSTCTSDTPHWPRTYLYSSKSVHIKSEDDIMLVTKSMNFPAILKLEHGSCAVGATMVKSEDELKNKYKEINESLQSELDFPGIGLSFDNTLVAMEFLRGYEHNVNVIIYDRKLIAADISDKGPTRFPNFAETTAAIPSSLPADKQAQLFTAAYQCCKEIGLSDGVFSVELMTTKTGPKLIEINARMSGLYGRKWIRKIYGVDLMLVSFMIASGVQPYIPKHPPNTHIVGVCLVPSLHAQILRGKHFRNNMNEQIIIFPPTVEEGEMPTVESEADEYEMPIANIAVCAATRQEAKYKLLDICRDLKIDQDTYQVEEFLKYF